jgi:hypothetical protein
MAVVHVLLVKTHNSGGLNAVRYSGILISKVQHQQGRKSCVLKLQLIARRDVAVKRAVLFFPPT